MYRLDESKQAGKDYETAERAGRGAKLDEILAVMERDPYEDTPGHRFEQLVGNLKGACSRRIDYHNRIVYTVHPNTEGAKDDNGNLYDGIVRVHNAWGHRYMV
jgi:Txe/YoeB family toxin of toxin-antitoxin system